MTSDKCLSQDHQECIESVIVGLRYAPCDCQCHKEPTIIPPLHEKEREKVDGCNGTFTCPRCGVRAPHHHDSSDSSKGAK